MPATAKFIKLLQTQIENQQKQMEAQAAAHQEQIKAIIQTMSSSGSGTVNFPSSLPSPSVPVFEPFDSTSELWPDYYDRFLTFLGAHNVNDRKAQIV